MALQDKTSTTKPTSFTPGLVPDFPHVNADLLNVPGMQEQQTKNQSWWGSVKQSLFNQYQADGINISANGAAVKQEAAIRSEADGFLEGKYTLQVTAGNVVTGMVITSSTAANGGTVSDVTFQTDRFKIYNGTTGQTTFDVSGGTVRLGGTLVVNTTGNKVYIGAGNYANADTAWFVDSTGRMSLKNKLTWDGTTLSITGSITATTGTIGGWSINPTTLTGGNVTLDSAGQLVLGTANDVVYASASNGTYRLWAGNAVAGSASFSVTKTGALFSNSGTIGGFSITGSTLAATNLFINSAGILTIGPTAGAQAVTLTPSDIFMSNSAGTSVIWRFENDGSDNGYLEILDSTHADTITLNGNGGIITAGSYNGSGSGLTTLNASNISSGTIGTARLPSTISISTAYQISGTTIIDSSSNVIINGNASRLYLYNTSNGTYIDELNGIRLHGDSGHPIQIVDGAALLLGNGSAGSPSVSFSSDTDTGWFWNASGDMRASTNGSSRLVVRDAAVVLLVPLKMDNAYVGGAPAATGYITLQDSNGTTYKVLVG